MRLFVTAILCLTFQARADQYFNPGASLNAREKELAMLTLQSHYNNIINALTIIKIPVLSRENLLNKTFCTVSFKASIPKLVPKMEQQGYVFSTISKNIKAAINSCHEQFVFTKESLDKIRNLFLEIYIKNSGSAFCKIDRDCTALRISQYEKSTNEIYTGVSTYITDFYLLKGLQFLETDIVNSLFTTISNDIDENGTNHPNSQDKNLSQWRYPLALPINGAVCRSNLCQFSL